MPSPIAMMPPVEVPAIRSKKVPDRPLGMFFYRCQEGRGQCAEETTAVDGKNAVHDCE